MLNVLSVLISSDLMSLSCILDVHKTCCESLKYSSEAKFDVRRALQYLPFKN